MNPSEMEVYEKLGITYTRMGRFEDAHRMFAHMLSVAPNSATTYNNLGSLYLTERRWTEAAEALHACPGDRSEHGQRAQRPGRRATRSRGRSIGRSRSGGRRSS